MKELWHWAGDAIKAALQQYGPNYVLLIIAVIILFWRLQQNWKERLAEKDEEIRRMAAEKKAMEILVLQNRLSTGLDRKEVAEVLQGGPAVWHKSVTIKWVRAKLEVSLRKL